MAIKAKPEDPEFRKKISKHGILLSYGYGLCPKSLTTDKSIPYISKSLYLLLSSLSGKGSDSFPSQNTIMSLLSCGPAKLKSMMDPLVKKGYVTIKSCRDSGRFSHNVYSINPCPECLSDSDVEEAASEGKLYSLLNYDSTLVRKGYGLIPFAIFKDYRFTQSNLHACVAVYGYLLSFASKSGVAYPAVSRILDDLGLGRGTWYKARQALQDYGYISVRQRNWSPDQSKRGFGANDVYIMDTLTFADANGKPLSCTTQSVTVKSVTVESMPDESTPVQSVSGESELGKSMTVNPTSNNNNINQQHPDINNSSKINPIYQPRSPAGEWARQSASDGLIDRERAGLSLSDYEDLISRQIEFDDLLLMYQHLKPEEVKECVRMAAIACRRTGATTINGVEVPPEDLRKAFLTQVTMEHFVYSMDRLREQSQRGVIRNISGYFISTLYTSLSNMNTFYTLQVEHDNYNDG